ncbi:MAG: DoxX family membrane protein [bacterium]
MIQNIKLGARLLLGLIFFVFGLNGFISFFPVQEGLNPKALSLMTSMQNSYLFTFIKSCEVFCGLLLLSGQFIPLALVCLAPIVINIFLFHLILQPNEIIIASAILVLEISLIIFHFSAFKNLLQRK